MSTSPSSTVHDSTNLDEAFQRVVSTMNTPSRTPRSPVDVGLSTGKTLDDAGFADRIIHWLKAKLGRATDASAAFYTAVKAT